MKISSFELILREKAEKIVSGVLGNCYLEGIKPVDQEFREQMIQKTMKELQELNNDS